MRTVGVRALKQNASAVGAEAAKGEVVTITDRGRPVAQLIPLPSTVIDTLATAGQARRPKRSLRDLGELDGIVSYDDRLSSAAQSHGITVIAPS